MRSTTPRPRPSPLPPVHPPRHPHHISPTNLLPLLLLLLNTHYAHTATAAADPSTDSTVQQFGSVSLAAQVRLRTNALPINL